MKKVSIGLALALCVVGCKKKKEEEAKEPAGSATAPMATEGSAGSAGAMAGSAAPAAEKTLAGPDMADRYKKCVGLVNDNKIDDFISTCIAADYKGHDMGGQEMAGADALKGEFTGLKTAFPDWKLTPQLIIISGRNILGVQMSQGTNSGPMKMPGAPEMPATNKKFGQLMFHKLAINDQNKATEEWAFGDPMTMMGQLGMLPKGAPPVRPVMDKGWDGAPIVAVTADNDAEKANLALVKKMDEAFNAHKVPDMLAVLSDDFVESDQADAADVKGKKDAEKGIKGFLAAFPDVKTTVDSQYAAGDYVVEIGSLEGTNTGDLGPIKKTGKKVNMHYTEISKIKDGKITNLWRFRNGMEAAMQLGLMPAPGAAPAAGSAAPAGAPPKK
jgi:predicted ester cyclase